MGRFRRRAAIVFVGVWLWACSAGSAPQAPVSGAEFWTVPDGAALEYDVTPARSGVESAPVVVLFHGLDRRARVSMSDWSEVLRSEGMLVVNADWFPPGATVPAPTLDGALSTPGAVACAIDHGRVIAREYAADSGNVIVVGVSAGAYGAALAALTWDRIDRAGCSAPPGPPPEVLVSLAGAYDAARRGPLATALADSPDVLAALDPFAHVDSPVVTRLVVVHGTADPVIPISIAEEFADRAATAGTPTELQLVDGGAHFEFGSPTTTEGAAALAIIVGAAEGR